MDLAAFSNAIEAELAAPQTDLNMPIQWVEPPVAAKIAPMVVTWQQGYDILQAYIAEFKTLPSKREKYQSISIGQWALNQCVKYKEGTLSAEYVTALESNPYWNWEHNGSAQPILLVKWIKNFNILQEYLRINKQFPKYTCVYRNIDIGRWFAKQRRDSTNKKLTQYQVEKMNTIPDWSARHHDKLQSHWKTQYAQLVEFVECFEDIRSIPPWPDSKIHQWVYYQRHSKNRYQSSNQYRYRIAMLEAIPGWTWAK